MGLRTKHAIPRIAASNRPPSFATGNALRRSDWTGNLVQKQCRRHWKRVRRPGQDRPGGPGRSCKRPYGVPDPKAQKKPAGNAGLNAKISVERLQPACEAQAATESNSHLIVGAGVDASPSDKPCMSVRPRDFAGRLFQGHGAEELDGVPASVAVTPNPSITCARPHPLETTRFFIGAAPWRALNVFGSICRIENDKHPAVNRRALVSAGVRS